MLNSYQYQIKKEIQKNLPNDNQLVRNLNNKNSSPSQPVHVIHMMLGFY